MKVLAKGTMPDGTDIQIEDWSENYSFHNYADTLATYPKSKMTHEGTYAPKSGETFRCSFRFGGDEEAKAAFKALTEGGKSLSDYREYMRDRLKYGDCI